MVTMQTVCEVFEVGNPVLENIGNDRYTSIVVKASATMVTTGRGKKYTLRKDGKWRLVGKNFGYLHHNQNGEASYVSPEF